jgi:hypothetical protein
MKMTNKKIEMITEDTYSTIRNSHSGLLEVFSFLSLALRGTAVSKHMHKHTYSLHHSHTTYTQCAC